MYTHEVNGLRSVLSNPNLLEDEPEQTQVGIGRGWEDWEEIRWVGGWGGISG